MWKAILRFEWSYEVRRYTTWAYCLFFLLAGMLSIAGPAGLFGASTTDASEPVNSAAQLLQLSFFHHRLFVLLIPLIAGGLLQRDVRQHLHTLLFSFPIRRLDYWLGKYLAVLLLLFLCSACLFFGFWLGGRLPGLQPELLADVPLGRYLQPWWLLLLPNLLSLSALCFPIVRYSRSLLPGFVLMLVFLLLHLLLQGLSAFEAWQFTAGLLDPLGHHAIQTALREQVIPGEQMLAVPLPSTYFLNQALWLGIGLSVWVAGWKMEHHTLVRRKPKANRVSETSTRETPLGPSGTPARTVPIQQLFALTRFEWHYLLRQRTTWIIALSGIALVLFATSRASLQYEFRLLPVSWELLAFPKQVWQFILSLFTFLQVGLLLQRARFWKIALLEDSTVCANWIVFSSKVLAILFMQGLLLFALLAGVVGLQLYRGVVAPNFTYLCTEILGIQWLHLAIWAAVAFLVHSLVRPVFLGFFILLVGQMGIEQLALIGLESPVFAFNQMEVLQYSELSGFDRQLGALLCYKFYWLTAAIGAFLLALLFRPSGRFGPLQLFRMRWNWGIGGALLTLLGCFAGLGAWLYAEEQRFPDAEARQDWLATNERQYRHYEMLPQPTIRAIKVTADLFPQKNSFKLAGRYLLVNTTGARIDSLLVHRPFNESCTYPKQAGMQLLYADDYSRYDLFRITSGLAPGDSLFFEFEVLGAAVSVLDRHPKVKANGTFLRTSIFPRIGYRRAEISDKELRRQYGLADLDSIELARQQNAAGHYQAGDSDWIAWEAVLSTDAGQRALAPGELIGQWQNGKRHFFHYRSAAPIKFSIGLFSGNFAVQKDTAGGIPVQIFYHPTQSYNLERLLAGVRQALRHNSAQFGPFSHKSLNLVEFPATEGSFATLYGNLIPFSELYFLAQVRPETEDLDLPFYVAAHELSHHWWGHQLLPAYGPGAQVLTESLAEYSALEILNERYGTSARRRFLEWDHRQYIQAHKSAGETELPLLRSKAEQEYINYRKGALVMQALAGRLGRPRFNALLADFLQNDHLRSGPFPSAEDFLCYLEEGLPEVWEGYLDEQFRQITTHAVSLKDVSCEPTGTAQFLVRLEGRAEKYCDGDTLALVHPFVVQLYGQNDRLLLSEQLQSAKSDWSFSSILDEQPVRVVLDPDYHLLDTERADNHGTFNLSPNIKRESPLE